MTQRPLATLLGLGVAILVLSSCTQALSTPEAVLPQATPDIEATVEARVRAELTVVARLTPTSTATPDPNIAVVREFARAQVQSNTAWEAFHARYDTWRQDDTGCSEEARRRDLARFVQDFTQVSQGVLGLSRHPDVQRVAELLAQAAEREERALSQLRDDWMPGSGEAFQTYEQTRVEVNGLRREAADLLQYLLVRGTLPPEEPTPPPAEESGQENPPADAAREDSQPVDPAAVQQFDEALSPVSAQWNAFHQEYDAWRQEDGECDQAPVVAALEGFLADFKGIAQEVYNRPRPQVVRPWSELLIRAAEREQLALEQMRDSWQPYDSSAFQAFAEERREVERLLRRVASGVDSLLSRYHIPLEEVAP